MATFLEVLILLLLSSFVFDGIHYFLHRLENHPHPLLRRLGQMHADHHRFFDEKLKINESYRRKNLVNHVLPEALTAYAVILLGGIFVSGLSLLIALSVQTCFFALNLYWQGEDPHHREKEPAPTSRFFSFWVRANYHRLHHIFPNRYYSSFHRLFDWLMGTGHHLETKRYGVSGTSSGLGREFLSSLSALSNYPVVRLKHGRDFNGLQVFAKEKLKGIDVLVLSHGNREPEKSMPANYWSYVNLIEAYRKVCEEEGRTPEVWAVGSEIEFHPSFGVKSYVPYLESKRAFQRVARYYAFYPGLIYRHIVPAAFRSQMGWGFFSARTVARLSLFMIKRQMHYIPVTYTGFAILNYFKFLFLSYQNPRDLYLETWFDPDLARSLTRQVPYVDSKKQNSFEDLQLGPSQAESEL